MRTKPFLMLPPKETWGKPVAAERAFSFPGAPNNLAWVAKDDSGQG